LLAVVGAALLGVAAIKLIELLGGAFDISFLRDVGNNAGQAQQHLRRSSSMIERVEYRRKRLAAGVA
jgi:hypothetical protein